MANTLLGFRVYHHTYGQYLHFSEFASQKNYLSHDEPTPISRVDAYRRIAAYLEQDPNNIDDFSVDPVHRELTPTEKVVGDLSAQLKSVARRYGLASHLSDEQLEAKLAQELVEYGFVQE